MAGRRARAGGETVGGKYFKGGQFVTKEAIAIEEGHARRGGAQASRDVRIEWFIKNVSNKVKMTMKQRVRLATSLLKDKVIRNISRPVTKGKGPRGGNRVTDRSKAGEFPKAETTHLMKTIFDTVIETRPGVYDGYVGTPLSYGLILETKLNRSFLVRSLREESPKIRAILTGPIK